jgi:uncharacterized protein
MTRIVLVLCALMALAGVAPPRVLIVGGGTSHDFAQFFQRADSVTLSAIGAQPGYTDVPADIASRLQSADVLYLTTNQPLPDAATRAAIMAHAKAGKGILIGHAGAWLNWRDWPELSREVVGGVARAHRRLGEFEVKVTAPTHPVMQGVPATFTLRDELYRFIPDTTGAHIEVLATAVEQETGVTYPIVFTVQHPNARIVVNTLGHDDAAHGHPAYQRMLQNSVRWVSRQP